VDECKPLAKGAAHSRVKLSTKSWGIDAAKVVTRAFANIATTLREVDLSDIIAGRPELEAGSDTRPLLSSI
jgi:Ran GTPase-activating protein (RanGAP) involved in mRNA processing and transport